MTAASSNPISRFVASASRRFAWLGILGAAILLSVLVVATGPSAEPLERAETAWAISTERARMQDLAPVFLTFGRVESRQVATLKTTINAPVVQVLFHEGAQVKEGELLVQLDAAEADLAVSVNRANLDRQRAILASVNAQYRLAESLLVNHRELSEIAESKLERSRDLHGQNMISDSALDEARRESNERQMLLRRAIVEVEDFPNQLAQQEAIVAEADAHYGKSLLDQSQTRILAPFDGRIISGNVAKGDRVIAGTSIVEIADYSDLELRASLPQHTALQLRSALDKGYSVRATADGEGRKLEFDLIRLSGDIKAGQSGVDAFFRVEPQSQVNIGRTMALAVRLPAEQGVVAMPVHALYENNTLFKVVENRLQAVRYQEVGDYLTDDEEFSVLVRSQDVGEGDLLLVSQLPRAITGLLVEPIAANSIEVEALSNSL